MITVNLRSAPQVVGSKSADRDVSPAGEGPVREQPSVRSSRRLERRPVFRALEPHHREFIARKWLKEKQFFWGKVETLQNQWWHHFVSIFRHSQLDAPMVLADRNSACSRWSCLPTKTT